MGSGRGGEGGLGDRERGVWEKGRRGFKRKVEQGVWERGSRGSGRGGTGGLGERWSGGLYSRTKDRNGATNLNQQKFHVVYGRGGGRSGEESKWPHLQLGNQKCTLFSQPSRFVTTKAISFASAACMPPQTGQSLKNDDMIQAVKVDNFGIFWG